jgi:hypothetical protein
MLVADDPKELFFRHSSAVVLTVMLLSIATAVSAILILSEGSRSPTTPTLILSEGSASPTSPATGECRKTGLPVPGCVGHPKPVGIAY